MQLWIEEHHRDFLINQFRVKQTLFSGKSDFQQVDIVEAVGYGRMLFIDGLVMVSERDEFIYHDMISHVPLFSHPNPQNVLIIGGGDGGTLREVLRHDGIESCVMVEIDPVVVHACKEFLPQTSCSMAHPKAQVLIQDGIQYVKETDKRFDLVLVDSTDPIGPATPLFGEDFYQNVFRILKQNGIVVAQGESPYYEMDMQKDMLSRLAKIFPKTGIYNYSNLTYPGALWSFIYGTKGPSLRSGEFKGKIEQSGMTCQYYNHGIHTAAFQLPSFQKEQLSEWLRD
ncbi:MAG: spermidine synthase [Acidobacteria bacterium]|nr:MAG: spermidine synthase [Acidobacteriota bacterium]